MDPVLLLTMVDAPVDSPANDVVALSDQARSVDSFPAVLLEDPVHVGYEPPRGRHNWYVASGVKVQ